MIIKIILFITAIQCAYSDIINVKVLKNIDITTQLVKIVEIISFRNIGLHPVQKYIYILDPDVVNVYVEFFSTDILLYKKQNESTYIINLPKPVLPNTNSQLKVELTLMDKIKTVEVNSRNERIVRYVGNLYFYSLYKSLICEVIYNIDQLTILEVSEKPTERNERRFLFVSQSIEPYTFTEISVIYVNDIPFFVATRLDRKIDISHLGSVFIEDTVYLMNEGLKINHVYEPSFKRISQILHTYLPASASNIKLFDDIGNNSKSTVEYYNTFITISFEARYPLKQGWKTKYVLQYNVPAYEYLTNNGDLFSVKMRAVDHVLPDVIIREAHTKVILPQDSKVIRVSVNGDIKQGKHERIETALSFYRPTVTFTAKNIPDNCVPEFLVTYTTPWWGMFKPACFISAYIEVILFSYVAFRRIDTYLRTET